ncbi:MAG: hypothetical protein C4576_06510 [Desulfobacteraceae bacterium]|nr:MAG: hypothetical protein C4576_06510 [Desulfobacteraceae bacterium]
MQEHLLIPELAAKLREIYGSGGAQGEPQVESFLESMLQGRSAEEKRRILQGLHSEFVPVSGDGVTATESGALIGADVYTRIFSLLLGKKVQQKDLSSQELLQKLAASLKAIFDVVNDLLSTTNTAGASSDQTIRHMVGLHLSGESRYESLESYLGQIKAAIRSSHEAYQAAFASKLREVLLELSPGHIEEKCGKSIRFGPLRKAELFDEYSDTFEGLKTWLESGNFMEDFMAGFQSELQSRLLSMKGGIR